MFKQVCVATLTLLTAALLACADEPTWTDPDKAASENADFKVQGEYTRNGTGYQVVAMGDGKFTLVACHGGLPGDGFNGKTTVTSGLDAAGVKSKLGDAEKVHRKSPTLGAEAPDDAIVLFDGSKASLDHWNNGKLDGDLLREGTKTAKQFGSFKLHLEFRMPFKPHRPPSHQDRGNSGVYTFNRYETQLLDTFGLHYNTPAKDAWRDAFKKDLGYGPKSDRSQWGGCFYKTKTPDVNMQFPPLAWQTYDIEFTAPKFKDGKKIANARFTVYHNGVKIHDDVELEHGTGAGGGRKEVAREAIYLQGHGNPVRFRNIWIVPRD